jgi:hypothetical protein
MGRAVAQSVSVLIGGLAAFIGAFPTVFLIASVRR